MEEKPVAQMYSLWFEGKLKLFNDRLEYEKWSEHTFIPIDQ